MDTPVTATESDTEISHAGRIFVDAARWADENDVHRSLALLRQADPVRLVDEPGFPTFWALTRHADVQSVELQPAMFTNAPRPNVLSLAQQAAWDAMGGGIRSLIHIDGEEHRLLRGLTVDWFKPSSLRKLEGRLNELAEAAVQRMIAFDGRCDFAHDIAVQYPLEVILTILGLPSSDYARMHKLTQELFGSDDPELARGMGAEDMMAVIADFFAYYADLTAKRRAHPTDDLASVIANGTVNGELLGELELLSYYLIITTAGHDTTSASIAGGLRALIEHPDQMERLRADPKLIDVTADEILRWVSPVRQMARTASQRTVVGEQTVEAGDLLLLCYPSANRDEAVFDQPFAFDVGRSPNPHLAMGVGVHYCLGAMLAKLEIRAFLRALIPRLRSIELDGEPELSKALQVGGLKRLPVRYEIA